jgi:carboxymethylenebutenolidase
MMRTFSIIIVAILAGVGLWWLFVGTDEPEQPADQQPPMTRTGSAIATSSVNYFDDATGYLATPTSTQRAPGVVMVHEWWGLNEHIKNQADELAAEGYRVLAVDLYDGAVATSASRAQQFSSSIDQERARSNMQAAVAYLRGEGAPRIAGLGWCFGGGQALSLAMTDTELAGHVIYYGSSMATSTDALASVQAPVLGIFGADDQVVPTTTVAQFERSLNELGIENEIHMYEGVGHAFANPSNDGYAPEKAADAWQKTLRFLEQRLQTE